MLIPKQIIKKKKININKINIDSYPYQCHEFLKDNWCFYQQMYISCRNNKFDINIWFNFIKPQYYDSSTIYTALGYFADVMIPFARYQFSGSFKLTQSLQIKNNSKNIQTLSIMKILPKMLIGQLIKYCNYQPIYTFLKTAILICIEDPRDYQISRTALVKIIKGVQVSNILSKFPINNSDVNQEVAKTMDYLENVANALKQMSQNIQLNSQAAFRTTAMISAVVESGIIKYSINQLIQSRLCRTSQVEKDRAHGSGNQIDNSPRTIASSTSSSQVNTTNISINIYNNCPLPGLGKLPPLVDGDEQQIAEILFKILSTMVQVFVRLPRTLNIIDEDQQLPQQQQQLKIKISQVQPVMSPTFQKILKQKPKQFTYKQYQNMIIQYRQQMQYLLDNMQQLNKFVYNQNDGNYKSIGTKIIPFASGQNVKAISFMKYQYFKLIYNVLIMIQCKGSIDNNNNNNNNNHVNQNINQPKSQKKLSKDEQQKSLKQIKEMEREDSKQAKQAKQANRVTEKQEKQPNSSQSTTNMTKVPSKQQRISKLKSLPMQPFDFKIQKLQLIQIIKVHIPQQQKYLNDNRWNNIAHHMLQKIIHSLIICSYDILKKNIQKDKKNFSDSFLSFLIQTFNKRDHVFLQTVKFTPQGNLHSLYNIAKDLAYTLNSTNQLVIFLNEFEPWKKFIMTDLKNYQDKIFPNATRPQIYDKNQNQQCSNLKVDQADSIKKLIENISKIKKKWPNRNKNKSLSKSGIFECRSSYDRGSLDYNIKNQGIENQNLTKLNKLIKDKQQNPYNRSKQKEQDYGIQGLQQILKKKIESRCQNNEVRQFDISQISVRDKLEQGSKNKKKQQINIQGQNNKFINNKSISKFDK